MLFFSVCRHVLGGGPQTHARTKRDEEASLCSWARVALRCQTRRCPLPGLAPEAFCHSKLTSAVVRESRSASQQRMAEDHA